MAEGALSGIGAGGETVNNEVMLWPKGASLKSATHKATQDEVIAYLKEGNALIFTEGDTLNAMVSDGQLTSFGEADNPEDAVAKAFQQLAEAQKWYQDQYGGVDAYIEMMRKRYERDSQHSGLQNVSGITSL